jgi:hypothetical protein
MNDYMRNVVGNIIEDLRIKLGRSNVGQDWFCSQCPKRRFEFLEDSRCNMILLEPDKRVHLKFIV